MKSNYPNLFSPIRIGNQTFRNRIFSAPIEHPHKDGETRLTDDGIEWFVRKAQGGAATVNLGSVNIADFGRIGPHIRANDPGTLPTFYRVAAECNAHGAVTAAELMHCGMNSYLSKAMGYELYSAVECKNAAGMVAKEMPEEEIYKVIEAYADAAMYLKYCGFGMVTIHAGHGWLLNQFANPSNTRKDQWGGSIENQCRIINATIDRIHQKCGRGFPVDVRMSASSLLSKDYDLDYGIEVAKQLEGHADLINVSVGLHEEPTVIIRTVPSMFMDDGANLKYAAEIKKHVSTPISTVGGFSNPKLMEEVIASGKADIIYLGRATMADPDLPIKAMTGREDEIRKCVRCLECYSAHCGKLEYACAINPEQGRERRIAKTTAKVKKKVLVVGGGVGGMQAALTASECGHEVILCEQKDQLGGALRCEAKVPFKQSMQHYLDTQAHLLEKSNVEVYMNQSVTPEYAKSLEPDVIIAAVGATPVKPAIAGIDNNNVISADEAFMNAEAVGEKVAILGGGLVGIELAIYLTGLGKKATIIEMSDNLNDGGNFIHSLALSREINTQGIEVYTCTKAAEIREEGVLVEGVGDAFAAPVCPTIKSAIIDMGGFGTVQMKSVALGEKEMLAADTIVYAVGQRPLHNAAEVLNDCAAEFYQIGDCRAPRNVLAANQEAYTIAINIGRM